MREEKSFSILFPIFEIKRQIGKSVAKVNFVIYLTWGKREKKMKENRSFKADFFRLSSTEWRWNEKKGFFVSRAQTQGQKNELRKKNRPGEKDVIWFRRFLIKKIWGCQQIRKSVVIKLCVRKERLGFYPTKKERLMGLFRRNGRKIEFRRQQWHTLENCFFLDSGCLLELLLPLGKFVLHPVP